MDLYAVLGLEAGASAAEIKRAYRRLARRYHPGINPGDPAAETMFRRVTEAYETLVDPARREQYDAQGGRGPQRAAPSFEFAGFDFTVTAQGAQAATFTELFADVLHPVGRPESGRPETGADVHAHLSLSFVDAMRGVARQVVVTRQDLCGLCGGAGAVATPEGRCAGCHGTGTVRWARGHMVFSKPCAGCQGSGRQRQQRCGACGGQGRVVRSDAVRVEVPAGASDGARLRLPEGGHAGRHGGRPGDLYVTLHVAPHPLFRREGDDLVLDVPIALDEAVLGARIEVPALEGRVPLRIPAGTQPGARLRVRGQGAPTADGSRGDLIAQIQLVLPAAPDERSRALIREFGERNRTEVRTWQ